MADQETQAPIHSAYASDPDYAELIGFFVDEIPQRIAALIEAYDRGDAESLRRVAHQLKGAAGSYGFHDVTPFAAVLEQRLKGGAAIAAVEGNLRELAMICGRMRVGTASSVTHLG